MELFSVYSPTVTKLESVEIPNIPEFTNPSLFDNYDSFINSDSTTTTTVIITTTTTILQQNKKTRIINNNKLKIILDASNSFKGRAISNNHYLGKCVQGPQEWFRKAGINLSGWWQGHNKDLKAFVNDPKVSLNRAGFVPIAHMTMEQSRNIRPEDLHPGDIMVSTTGQYASANHGYHGAMWDGTCWKSDTKQTNISGVKNLAGMGMPYHKTTAGDWAVVIYRNPQLQEAGVTVTAWQGLHSYKKGGIIKYLKSLK